MIDEFRASEENSNPFQISYFDRQSILFHCWKIMIKKYLVMRREMVDYCDNIWFILKIILSTEGKLNWKM